MLEDFGVINFIESNMDKDNIYVEDKSGDKKYFTMLPNFILNHSTAIDQALYCQLKKHAGENGICYVSEKTLKEKLGIGIKALKKSFDYLLKREWIKERGLKDVMTKGGIQKVKSYSVVDIWELNTNFYKGVSESDPLPAKGCPKGSQRGALLSNKEELIQEDNTLETLSTKISDVNLINNNTNPMAWNRQPDDVEEIYIQLDEDFNTPKKEIKTKGWTDVDKKLWADKKRSLGLHGEIFMEYVIVKGLKFPTRGSADACWYEFKKPAEELAESYPLREKVFEAILKAQAERKPEMWNLRSIIKIMPTL